MYNRYNILKTKQNGELDAPDVWGKKNEYSVPQKSKRHWIKLLSKEHYKTMVTIQAPMKNKYKFDTRIEYFFKNTRVKSLFYSVEQNADKLGYHIHLLFTAYRCNKYNLAWSLDTPVKNITYYKDVDHNFRVVSYVNKRMRGDQIHYNFYKK